MEEEQELIPMFTADLLKHLDEIVARPEFPTSREQAAAFDDGAKRRGLFQAGMREIVDMLLEWQAYSEEVGNDESEPDVPRTHGARTLGEGSDVREVTINVTGGVDEPTP